MRLLKKSADVYRVKSLLVFIRRGFRSFKARSYFIYHKYSKPTYGLNRVEHRKEKIIVSLTSFPERFQNLHICLKSIMKQTYKPDKIILYLGDDSKRENLTPEVLELTRYGLDIEFREDNIKPHKKYLYAMQEYPNDIIITVDDDIIHQRNLVKELITSYFKYPNAVSAKRVHRIRKYEDGSLAKYIHFEGECRNVMKPSMDLLATTGAGVLFPPNCKNNSTKLFFPCEMLDIELIKKLCLSADDIWLKFMQIKNNIPVVWVSTGSRFISLPSTHGIRLCIENVKNGKNDFYITQLQNYFNVNLSEYCNISTVEEEE